MAASVSVILPAFNERDNVLSLIDEIHSQLKRVPHHIVLIDDQSTDGTERAVAALGDPRVLVLQTSERLGLGKSIRMGIDRSKGDYIVVMDSDFNHQPGYLPFMISAMGVYDGAFASRFSPGGGMTSLWRQFLSRSFNVFVQWKLNSPVKDHLYGFFIIRREVLMRLPFDDIFWGYGDYCMRLIYFL
ncbi:MAG: glycosyltransferase, partial [Candidatus Omnitrophica bacterium]|nr:glycosyltransferase [Candidatus Omnitrophota bacterium]